MFRTFSTSLTVLFLSSACLAYPDVGDRVSWTGEIVSSRGEKQSIHITKEVLSKNADSQWKVKISATVGSQKTEQTTLVRDLFTPEQYKSLMTSCQNNGGVVEKLSAPAGTYDTCKLTNILPDGTLVERWWGDIPFGVVSKSTRTAGTSTHNPDVNSIVAGL